ncbi:hypothetical protein AB0K18_19910 [Nonomuraea sp. NPDC049421]|uniref:hypothetical protein n=1 Tax=Nonomuraea sp. NPDC049421 TaxID=3155275 RepID=UPI003432C32F
MPFVTRAALRRSTRAGVVAVLRRYEALFVLTREEGVLSTARRLWWGVAIGR